MNNKNILIGGLIAIVCVMGIAYAAFSTQLNINGTANVTSTWSVGFDTTKTSGTGVITPTAGLSGATTPTGTIAFPNSQTATITANFKQPGDKVVFTITIKNTGTLKAKLAAPTLTMTGGTVSGLTATKGNIRFTVSNPASTSVAPTTGWQTTAPTWINGRYIWSRTKVSYSDNTTTYTKAVCITGGKGSTGDSGVGVS